MTGTEHTDGVMDTVQDAARETARDAAAAYDAARDATQDTVAVYDAATRAVRIAVVDDHRLFLGGLTHLLEADPRFEVVGQALSGEEFLELESVRARAVDVVFMDIDMAGMGGVEATRRAVEWWPEIRVVALSMHGDREFYGPMMEAGAKGFLMKSSEFAEVAAAAINVAAGGTYFSPELADALAEGMQGGSANVSDGFGGRASGGYGSAFGGGRVSGGGSHALGGYGDRTFDGYGDGISYNSDCYVLSGNEPDGSVGGRAAAVNVGCDPLSEREMEVLPLVCRGLSNVEIAERLFISKRTVDKHRANILAKTGCKNTASLVIFTIKHNLIEI